MVRGLFRFSDEARGALGLAIPSAAAIRPQWEALRSRAQQRCGRAPRAARFGCLRSFLFGGWGLEREVDDPDLRHGLVSEVIRTRRGSCLGLSSLVLALAESLALPAAGVLVPGHLFVRLAEGAGSVNAELLRQGEGLPDEWYVHKYQVPAFVRAYLRPLSLGELLAVLRFNLGNALRLRGEHGQALRLYGDVVREFPQLAEGQASAGLSYHLLDRPLEAWGAYGRAWLENPALPGLAENLGALLGETGRLLPWLR